MKPPMTDDVRSRRAAGIVSARRLYGFGVEGRGLGVAAVGDDHLARIDVRGVDSRGCEVSRDDEAREALAKGWRWRRWRAA